MAIEPGPHDLTTVRYVLGPDGAGTLAPDGPDFYANLDRDHDGFRGRSLVSQYRFEQAWPTWEMHPSGDELVYLIDGDVDFVLRVDGADQVIRVREPGSYVVVPRGTWHTARPRRPTTMLFITPGEGTENREAPPA